MLAMSKGKLFPAYNIEKLGGPEDKAIYFQRPIGGMPDICVIVY